MADPARLAGVPSIPPAHLLNPPDVDGLVSWIRAESTRRREHGFLHVDEAVAIARSQLAAVALRARSKPDDAQTILGDEELWRPLRHPRLRSHRRVIGPLVVWCKRHLIGPFIRWHVEFTEDNASRQAYVNQALLGLVDHLGAQTVLLERRLEILERFAAQAGTVEPGGKG